jgi:hydroxymethylpyrimidine pyrophosphatase-like HAD family hydrolase
VGLRSPAHIDANRDQVGLIFVTGRDPGFLETLCRETEVPWPDYVVGDVGTTIAEIRFDDADPEQGRLRPMEALEKPIVEAWNNAGPRVREALDGHPGLTLQPTRFRHRVSYDYDPAAFDPCAIASVEEMGLDALISADRFFDVLPRGVSKGPSLRRLLAHLGVAENKCLVAGDTLNDLSMLEMDWPAVAVGGSEPGLLQRLQPRGTLHRARAVGAGGILEAVATLGLHPSPPRPEAG